jgi:hypothetical protein
MGAALLTVIAACSSAGDGATPKPKGPGTALFDGLTVAAGSHLVGPVFTEPAESPDGEQSIAVVSIDRDPVAVYDAYAREARQAGFLVGGSGTVWPFGEATCGFVFPDGLRTPFDAPEPKPLAPGSVAASTTAGSNAPTTTTRTVAPVRASTPSMATAIACSGAARRANTTETLRIESTWGAIVGSPPTRHVLIAAGTQPLFAPLSVGDARVPTPTGLPTVSTPYATRAGEPFGTKNNAFDSGYARFTLAAGSRVVAELPDRTLLYLDGNTREVLAEYARQLGQGGEPGGNQGTPPIEEAVTSHGTVLTVENGPSGGGGARLLTDPSGRWLLIKTSSD